MGGRKRRRQAGFTLLELLIVTSIVSLVGLIATTSYRSFRERSILTRAARTIAADIVLTRSYAIRARAPVSLVAIEAERRYVIRDASGNVFKNRAFNAGSDLPLTTLDVATTGDSVTFTARGVMSTALAFVNVTRPSGSRQVQTTALGRSRVVTP